MQLNFHEKLNYLSTALDENDLIEIMQVAHIHESPEDNSELLEIKPEHSDFVKDPLTIRIERISQTLQQFLVTNASHLSKCDLNALRDLNILVHDLRDHCSSDKPNALEKTITASIDLIYNTMHLPEDLDIIRSIPSLYAQRLFIAALINRDRIPIKDLPITKEELMALGPALTYLDCRDAFRRWDDEEMINFLSTCRNLKSFYINSPQISVLPELPYCEIIFCDGCLNLKSIVSLPVCQQFSCTKCPSLCESGVPGNLKAKLCDNKKTELEHVLKTYDLEEDRYFRILKNMNSKRLSPIQTAILGNAEKVVKVLNELGISRDALDGISPMIWAIFNDRPDMAKLLIDKECCEACKKYYVPHDDYVNFLIQCHQEKQSALETAIIKHFSRYVKVMHELGVDVNKVVNEMYPSMLAMSSAHAANGACAKATINKEIEVEMGGSEVAKGSEILMTQNLTDCVAITVMHGYDTITHLYAERRMFHVQGGAIDLDFNFIRLFKNLRDDDRILIVLGTQWCEEHEESHNYIKYLIKEMGEFGFPLSIPREEQFKQVYMKGAGNWSVKVYSNGTYNIEKVQH